MFMPGHADHLALTSPYVSADQLEGVLELLDFANALVLSDHIAIGGVPTVAIHDDSIGTLLRREAERYGHIELVGFGGGVHRIDFDLAPYHKALGVEEFTERLRELRNQRTSAADEQVDALSDSANERQAWSYMMLADKTNADYVAERRFGIPALKTYPNVVKRASPHSYGDFVDDLSKRMSQSASAESVATEVPSFLLEAMRNSESLQGMLGCLRDIWDSAAARHYRDLIRTVRTSAPGSPEWRDAAATLKQEATAAFGNEGMPSRAGLRWAKPTIGLTGIALGTLFTEFKIVSSVLGVALPFAIDEMDKYIRNRSNIFELYKQSLGTDLYQELKRLFPHIAFQREHLAFFLEKRHFGWDRNLEDQLRLAQTARQA